MNKELLEVLVAVVDAQLLEGVAEKCLKAEDVQHSNRQPLLLGVFLQKQVL